MLLKLLHSVCLCCKETAFVLVRHWHWAAGWVMGSGFIRQQVAGQSQRQRHTSQTSQTEWGCGENWFTDNWI